MENNRDPEKFCPTCGRPYVNKRDGVGETVRRCPACQHSVNRYDNFCRYCGHILREECKHD